MNTTPAISLRGLSKRYGTVEALSNVSLDVHPGELFGLIGPDGAGKSTLYRILTTLEAPDTGQALIGGHDTVDHYRRLRTTIGYMPERFSLYPFMTVAENLKFFASLFGVSVQENFDLIAPIYNPQLSKFPKRRAGALSGGMKQKLALCCALIHRPEILLLDEPTTGVDAVSRSEFWEILSQLRELGITIMVSTSYMDEAERCQRIALMAGGRILGVDAPTALVGSLDERLYNASADDMFALLEALRGMPGVANCYTFGATLHIVADADFDADATRERLRRSGILDAKITPAKGDVEDLFIKLMRQ